MAAVGGTIVECAVEEFTRLSACALTGSVSHRIFASSTLFAAMFVTATAGDTTAYGTALSAVLLRLCRSGVVSDLQERLLPTSTSKPSL